MLFCSIQFKYTEDLLLMAMWGNEQNKRRDAMPSDATPDTTPFWYPFDFFPGLRIIIYIFPIVAEKTDPVLMPARGVK